ncbi:RNA 2',3'-cyclic phosphodiesterase [Nitratifractor sp.]
MRLFIASPVILYDYTSIRRDFSTILNGKWVEERNLHLTWVFLGEQESTEPILERMKEIAPLSCPVLLSSLGLFGTPPHILYSSSRTRKLHRKAREFVEAGIELRHFNPHVTLCRIKKIRDWKRFKKMNGVFIGKVTGMILPEILLFESRLSPEGPIYRELGGTGN